MEKPLFAALGLRLVCVISLPCPTCGSELAFLEQYQRHYCYACGNYAPEGYGDRGAKVCQAKKPALMDLCKAYNLDPTGTKEALRERLLSYLDTLEGEAEEEQGVEEPESRAEPAATEPTAGVERESWPTARETSEAHSVEEEPETGEPTAASPPAVIAEAFETGPLQESVVERVEAPVLVSVAESQPDVFAAPAIEPTRALHPCPTCGRELTYIARYRRWYCYHCRAYAPLSESKFACPTCGAALRWIGQYERWWCDSCRRYAPADLPKPEAVAVR